ncbi:hypothetical protein ABB37_07333 [Leptomonas pyrrhocoris]|uniref:Uncharacterized protein n=1 Tax=Leptomonas pyrrhocoris TaxID=157538 RepID=A0A0M9FVK1_LEPPY|nr:hypothetical protein ABB37_07333 [Leptomonas pyrrhocoris]XP_015655402.1 hypothetical protein ABB37_07333 [Leptomonas pyrrhocoris]XP_015655403.1 hypothetical protein ABB37_07333 [Leptomonas pyrrhocoris]XP_015655404.1 hypothetical protein ABB37_07333 [Leptomonas pyrrhocoris]KPA76962.1 hypothetical protein ABB37_07333 [Leptomonas pyrrhocoris]KPA76963.1 hypothetical protein ABB37_07333 [Leptomonas pyrrhocoris]KPA76964.1 hypothetical protein ABB37_07333 [Leptomonas pyrrhocoris]KPA76965.1 hypot|eukprot:XP_015655401.1 hypothetical protein ABB37_07333 [Leptomonas pyrrhocoris]
MPPPSPSPTPAGTAPLPLAQRLQQLQAACGKVYETYAPAPSSPGSAADAAAAPKKLDHHERSRLQTLVTEQVSALYQESFASSARVQIAGAELEKLLRLLPSLVAVSAPPAYRPPLLMTVVRVLHPRRNDSPTPHVPDAVLAGVLLSLVRLLHHPDPWAAGQVSNVTATRASAAALLAQLLRHFVIHAQEAAVVGQWRQWQELANNALLDAVRIWIEEMDVQRPPAGNGAAHKRSMPAKPSPKLSPSAACVLSQLLDLVDALVEHPCAHSLPNDAWLPALTCVVRLGGSPQEAPQHLELSYAVLQVLMHVREKGVVSPGVWRQLALGVVAKSIPHGSADAPDPIPASSLSTSATSYAALFLKYVHLTKSLMFVAVEESSTDSSTARATAAELHTVLAGLVELSSSVLIEKASAADSAAATSSSSGGGRVSLLAAVVKDLLTVREESHSAPRQYARYVQGMFAGSTPLVPYIIQVMATECYRQMPLLAAPNVPSVLATNAEILQGVFLWSIHAIIDEGLLDSTRRTVVAAALPYALCDAADAVLGQLNERLSVILLSNPALAAQRDVPLLAVRVIACEGLALLLHFLLFVVALYGITDEVSWNVHFRDRLHAAEARVMRTVGTFDCGVPHVLRAFTDALDRMSSTLGPTAAKVSALLPNSTRPSLASSGCHGALDNLFEVIPIF